MLALTITDHWDDGKRFHVIGTITPTVNYATGGDILNLGIPNVFSSIPPVHVNVTGVGLYLYSWVAGTTLANGKMKAVSLATQAEVPAGAYPAGITADVIQFYGIFRKR